ncbi:MAG: hypothetical protein MUC50_17830 [Myxococcota bacterium]|jgi:hypothetical protein|nr:hypothetical protein [Myxococcota bacterium]
MFNEMKEKVVNAGMGLMKSPMIGKVLESEKFGALVEKAVTLPFKVTNAVMTQRDKVVALLDLATQRDLDDLRRGLSRMESALDEMRNK